MVISGGKYGNGRGYEKINCLVYGKEVEERDWIFKFYVRECYLWLRDLMLCFNC